MPSYDSNELKHLAADLGKTGGSLGAQAAAAIRKTARQIEAQAKALAPVETGNLRNSISTTITGDGRFGTIEAEIGPTASYGGYVERGTSRMAPEPYLGPAFDQAAPDLEAALEQIGGNLL